MHHGPGPLLPEAGHVVAVVFTVFGTVIAALVAVAVLVVLVRFLLVATKAAQLYVDEHAKPARTTPAPTPLVTHPTPDPAPDETIAAPSDLDEQTVIAPKRKRTPPPSA